MSAELRAPMALLSNLTLRSVELGIKFPNCWELQFPPL